MLHHFSVLFFIYKSKTNAKRITEGSVNGGHQVIYKVNDIVIFLKEFPPGINGDDRIYQVQMGHELTN